MTNAPKEPVVTFDVFEDSLIDGQNRLANFDDETNLLNPVENSELDTLAWGNYSKMLNSTTTTSHFKCQSNTAIKLFSNIYPKIPHTLLSLQLPKFAKFYNLR